MILGNPPYNRFAGVAEDEEADFIERHGDFTRSGSWQQLLDDLYIRFFRLAEKHIAEVSGQGIVCYISNYSWLDGLSHPVMRGALPDTSTPSGSTTATATSIGPANARPLAPRMNRCSPPTSIASAFRWARRSPRSSGPAPSARAGEAVGQVHYRDFWGTGNEKRAARGIVVVAALAWCPRYEKIRPRGDAAMGLCQRRLGQARPVPAPANFGPALPSAFQRLDRIASAIFRDEAKTWRSE